MRIQNAQIKYLQDVATLVLHNFYLLMLTLFKLLRIESTILYEKCFFLYSNDFVKKQFRNCTLSVADEVRSY